MFDPAILHRKYSSILKNTDKADDEFDKAEKIEDSLMHIEDEEPSRNVKFSFIFA
nr:3493_t:CDS:2 [Entrophospora candida]